ncbi:MAG TPA: hypothetical protein DCO83_08330 [Mucilaginibacter sp.]|nr:hypothetical protein [Mucilaginibacter sp.]
MKPFEIGLTLTGSVSAGAYTAGVIDFLLEALDAWERQKALNRANFGDNYSKWDVPWHDVMITGLSGASGGGVTCGLMLNFLGRKLDPVAAPPLTSAVNNDLYAIWVQELGIGQLSDITDLQSGNIKSLLNGDALPDIAGRTLTVNNFGNTLSRGYIAENLRATVTVSNLRGIPYWLRTKGIGATQVIYYKNTDYVKFELARNNTAVYPDTTLIPYNTAAATFKSGYQQLHDACLATCAFPAAFRVQPITQNESVYKSRGYVGELAIPAGSDYSFVCGDGGILNTDPFELLHQDMVPEGHLQNPRSGATVERSIIIVAPLDTDSVYSAQYDIGQDSLLETLPSVIGAIRNDAMFSDEQIGLALEEDVYSRYIIAPVRNDPVTDQPVTPSITGTAVGTFGAFLSEDFRAHDYFLGRRNAQQFFKSSFAIPLKEIVQNPIFIPLDIENNQARFRDFIFTEDGIAYFCILPLCGAPAQALYNPPWPAGKYNAQQIQDDLAKRAGRLIDIVLSDIKLNWLLKILKFFALNKLKSTLVDFIMGKITRNLGDNHL